MQGNGAKNQPSQAIRRTRGRQIAWSLLFFDFAKTYRFWITASLVLGLIGGGLVAFVFNPWVVKSTIRNVDGYFDLAQLTNIKRDLPFILAPEVEKVSDKKLALELKPYIKDLQWPEKNIEPIFAILRNDIQKALIGFKPTDTTMPGISFIELTFRDADKNELLKISQWMSVAIIKIALREKYISWVNNFQKSNDDLLHKSLRELADLITRRSNNQEQLEKTREIAARNPMSNSETGSLSKSVVGSFVGSNDLVKYLPLNSQVDGLALQEHEIKTNFGQLQFKIDLTNHIIKKSIDASRIALAGSLTPPFYNELVKNEFWREVIPPSALQDHAAEWARDYSNAILEDIYQTNSSFITQLDTQLNAYRLNKPKRKFGRIITVFIGGVAGLLAPLVGFLFINRDALLGSEDEVG